MILPNPEQIIAEREAELSSELANLMGSIKSQLKTKLNPGCTSVYLVLPNVKPSLWHLLVKRCQESGWKLECNVSLRNETVYKITWTP